MQIHPHDRRLFFSEQQRTLLYAVLDHIVPPNGDLPAAGELRVAEHVEGVAGLSQGTRRLFSEGLKSIEVTSVQMHSSEFVELSDEDKVGVLRQVESQNPDFFSALVVQTYAGYYTNPKVLRAKGLKLRPPQPQGYELDEFDMSLLENVRKRGKVYRDA